LFSNALFSPIFTKKTIWIYYRKSCWSLNSVRLVEFPVIMSLDQRFKS
jgi:hypothetical protein